MKESQAKPFPIYRPVQGTHIDVYKHNIIYPDEGSRSLSSPLGLRVQGSQMTGLWSLNQKVAELELFRITAMGDVG